MNLRIYMYVMVLAGTIIPIYSVQIKLCIASLRLGWYRLMRMYISWDPLEAYLGTLLGMPWCTHGTSPWILAGLRSG